MNARTCCCGKELRHFTARIVLCCRIYCLGDGLRLPSTIESPQTIDSTACNS